MFDIVKEILIFVIIFFLNLSAMRNVFLSLCFFLFLIDNSYGQGEYVLTNQSGFHLMGQIGSNKDATIIGVSPAYTANGEFTFGLTLGLTDYKDLDLSSTAIRPYFSFMALKQGKNNNPINLSIGAAYQHNIFSDIDDLTVNSVGINLAISHIIESSDNLKIGPLAGIGWQRSTVIQKYSQGFRDTYSESGLVFSVGASFMINQFFLTPVIGFHDGDSNFNLLFGYMFLQ